jgi:replicative DNA helicase
MYKELNKIKTVFFVLDLRLSGGFYNCNLVTIASRAQMGKRDLMLNIATNIAKDFGTNQHKKNVAIFSLTISEDELNHKLHSISNGEIAKFDMLYNEKNSKFIDMNDWKKEE